MNIRFLTLRATKDRRKYRDSLFCGYCVCGRKLLRTWKNCTCGKPNDDYKPKEKSK